MKVIGVDGGGTKTLAAVYDSASGKITDSISAGGMNYNFTSPEAAADEVVTAVRRLTEKHNDIKAIGIGDPSLDEETENPMTASFLETVKAGTGLPVYIRSDIYMALYGLTQGRAGVMTVSGTGAMSISDDGKGNIRTAGGWGRLTGDEGSGYYIALSGIKAVLRSRDGIAPATALTESFAGFCGEDNLRAAIGNYYASRYEISPFSKCVSECAVKGDETARGILKKAAYYLAGYSSSLIEEGGAGILGIYGSVLLNDKIVRDEFVRLITERYPGITIRVPSVRPEEAAAMYAIKLYGEGIK